MCRIYCVFVACISCVWSVYGRDIHALRPDTLIGEWFTFSNVGTAGKDVVWDFRSLTQPQETERRISLISQDDSTKLCVREGHVRTYYAMSGDTLFCIGYENAHIRMGYTQHEPILQFPFHYGDILSGEFAGKGEYCHRLPFTASGHTYTEVDGMGTLLLPHAQVKDIWRVHRCCTWTEISDNTTNMQEDVWQWYAKQCPHPLLEALRLTRRTEDTDSTLFSYIAMFPTIADESKDKEEERLLAEEIEDNLSERLLSDVSFLPNPVQTILEISYRLANDADIYISVHYSGGAIMYSTPITRETAGMHQLQVDMSVFPMGNYVLYIHANTMVVGETVIKL